MVVKFVHYGKLKFRISRFKDGRSRLEIVQRGIRDIPEVMGLDQLLDLEELDLSKNKIREITGLENLTNLRVLNISYNEISDPLTFKKLKEDHLNLVDINLRGNPCYNPIEVIKAEFLKPIPTKTQILTCCSDMIAKTVSQSPIDPIFPERIGEVYKLAPDFFMQTLIDDIKIIVKKYYGNEGISLMESLISQFKIAKIKKSILELGTKFGRLQVIEIAEECSEENSLIISTIKEMITNQEIYAQYFSSSKVVAFNQQANIAEIDKLMDQYKEWEDKEIGKK